MNKNAGFSKKRKPAWTKGIYDPEKVTIKGNVYLASNQKSIVTFSIVESGRCPF